MDTARGSATAPSRGTAPLAYFWGDSYGLEAAVEAFRKDQGSFPGGDPERWRPESDGRDPGRLLGEIRERLATGSMWGGSLAIVWGRERWSEARPGRRGSRRILATVAPRYGPAIVLLAMEGAPTRSDKPSAVRSFKGVYRGGLDECLLRQWK